MKNLRNRFSTLKDIAAILLALAILPTAGWCAGVVTNATEAALNAALVGGGTVTFACDGTITLTSTKIIGTNTVLDATGHRITISGGSSVQLFSVTNGNLTMFNLTLANGKQTNLNLGPYVVGGGIFALQGFSAYNCTFTNNVAQGTNGAAGANSSNGKAGTSGGDAYGGAIACRVGPLYLTNCVFVNNSVLGGQGGAGGNATSGSGSGGKGGAGGFALGGAIQINDAVVLTNCIFAGNTATGGNGGQGGDYGSSHTGKAGLGGPGGDGWGGDIVCGDYCETINCSLYGNAAYGGNAGLAGLGTTTSTNGAAGGNGYGGAMYSMIYSTTINSTFFGNYAVGGNGGSLQMGTGTGGNGGNGAGGGLYFTEYGPGDYAGVTNCTFSTNAAYGGAAGIGYTNGTAGQSLGGNIRNNAPAYGDTLTLKNSIFAYPMNGGNGSSSGTIVDAGQNISSDGSITLNGPGSSMNTDPKLNTLAYDGGFTPVCPCNRTARR